MYVENEGMHQIEVHTFIFNDFLSAFKAMPIVLETVVERELAARAKRAVFAAWRHSSVCSKRAFASYICWIKLNADLVRALLRFWAGRPVVDDTPTMFVWIE